MGRIARADNNESYTIQKIWGCLADAISFKRYESFAGSNDSTHYIKDNLTDEEIKKLYSNLHDAFKIKIDIELTERDTFKRFVTKVKKYVRDIEK